MAYIKINIKVVFCLVLTSSHTCKRKIELSQKTVNSLYFSVMQYTHTHTHKSQLVRAVKF